MPPFPIGGATDVGVCVSNVLNVRVSVEDEEGIRALADDLGLTYSACARMLMKEGLRARSLTQQATTLLKVIEQDLDLRMQLRRIVLANIGS